MLLKLLCFAALPAIAYMMKLVVSLFTEETTSSFSPGVVDYIIFLAELILLLLIGCYAVWVAFVI